MQTFLLDDDLFCFPHRLIYFWLCPQPNLPRCNFLVLCRINFGVLPWSTSWTIKASSASLVVNSVLPKRWKYDCLAFPFPERLVGFQAFLQIYFQAFQSRQLHDWLLNDRYASRTTEKMIAEIWINRCMIAIVVQLQLLGVWNTRDGL